MLGKIKVALLGCLLVGVFGLFFGLSANALSGSSFVAGNIISDPKFFSGANMSVAEIQAFLNAKVPVCDTWGEQPYGGGTRAQYGASRGSPAPYTCLKDFTMNTPSRSPESALCNGYTATASQSAAQIIHNVAVSCGVSPKVLIVLLEKEQSLVTDDWPWPIQYRSATGMGCPDTAPCSPDYHGFFTQVYDAARQFKKYSRDSHQYNHRAGYNNNVRYHPNAGCGSSTVFIQNQATAGLYNYTPYQPNAAALNDLYGEGDGCSAYGNRNFWRIYSDWFGPTQGGDYLLRSFNNATVYLVSGDYKYPISDIRMLSIYAPLGPVGYVSDNYLATKTTGTTLNRLVRAQNGTIYFVDSGIKLPFTDCGAIEQFGYLGEGCGNYVNLDSKQLSKFATGPVINYGPNVVYGTIGGKIFQVVGGKRKEVFDKQTLTAHGLPTSFNVLSEAGISSLPYDTPLMRDNVIVHQRGGGYKGLYYGGTFKNLDENLYGQTAISTMLKSAWMDSESINLVSKTDMNGYVRNTAGTTSYILTARGKVALSEPARWSASFMTVPDSFLNAIPVAPNPVNNGLVKSVNNGTVYYVLDRQKRVFASWSDLTRINNNPTINIISDYYLQRLTTGTRMLGPGSFVKSPTNGTVFMVDGVNKKIPLTTFHSVIDFKISFYVATVPQSALDSYTTTGYVMEPMVACGGKNYLATQNGLYEVGAGVQSHYGLSYVSLDALTCANIPKSTTQMGRFLLAPNGTIYYVDSGQKRPFYSYTKYVEYGGNSSNTAPVSQFVANQLPTGTPAN